MPPTTCYKGCLNVARHSQTYAYLPPKSHKTTAVVSRTVQVCTSVIVSGTVGHVFLFPYLYGLCTRGCEALKQIEQVQTQKQTPPRATVIVGFSETLEGS